MIACVAIFVDCLNSNTFLNMKCSQSASGFVFSVRLHNWEFRLADGMILRTNSKPDEFFFGFNKNSDSNLNPDRCTMVGRHSHARMQSSSALSLVL